MHDNSCFTGCVTIIGFLLFFFGIWATIESNIHERLLYQSQKSEVYTINKITDSIHRQEIQIDGRYHVTHVKVWYFTVNDSSNFWRKEKSYDIGDKVKRFYYINHRNQKAYSEFYDLEKNIYKNSTFWESTLFILYTLFFLLFTTIMYVEYFEYIKDQYNERLQKIKNVNLLDKIYNYLSLNKVIILISMLSVFLLINALGFYFVEVPETSINPSYPIFLFFILTFLIPVIFIQILRKKDKPSYRNLLNVIRITIVVTSIVSFFFTLIEFMEIGSLKETTILKALSETWSILKDLLSD
ncbi:hypothetical protein FBALC1_14827 [Flavobacteriales bacterium ALC-1]|nr:hypothetical protein FBALC1_14827 [Flavobacteriales bacterium ALC-1]